MHPTKASLFWLLAPAALALWLLVVTPSGRLPIDPGALGTAMLILTAWGGLWIASRIPVAADGASSPGEQRSWVALAFTAFIAAVMLFKSGLIIGATELTDLRGVGRTIVMLVIAWSVFAWLLRERTRASVIEDERDRSVQARSDAKAHAVLGVAVIGIAVTLGLSPPERLVWARPLVVAHLLLFALILANAAGHAVAIVLYRRDRA